MSLPVSFYYYYSTLQSSALRFFSKIHRCRIYCQQGPSRNRLCRYCLSSHWSRSERSGSFCRLWYHSILLQQRHLYSIKRPLTYTFQSPRCPIYEASPGFHQPRSLFTEGRLLRWSRHGSLRIYSYSIVAQYLTCLRHYLQEVLFWLRWPLRLLD